MTQTTSTSFRILVVDDSDLSLQMAEIQLVETGFEVMSAKSGEEALALMEEQGVPHLALVDINMPRGMDGFEFCDKIHQFCDVPVIMLTAVDDEEVVIQAIEEYAEDYIKKPVSQGELIARIRRVLHRIGNFAFPLTSYTQATPELAVNFARCEAIVQQKPVSLTPTETKLLYILMRAAGRLVTTGFLIRRLWPGETPQAHEDRLRVYVHRLRGKIEPSPDEPQYILSRRNKGYIFSYEAAKL